MKNFARLVHFAWPYKVRFGLSIACAAMVALLFFAELGAVYPLLHILFDSQNPQRWIGEKIEATQEDLQVLEARRAECQDDEALAAAGRRDPQELAHRVQAIHAEFTRKEADLRAFEGQVNAAELKEPADARVLARLTRLAELRRDHRV